MKKYPLNVEIKIGFLKYLTEITENYRRGIYLIHQIYSLSFHLLTMDQCLTLYKIKLKIEEIQAYNSKVESLRI